jgi:hypothetical protein
MSIKIILDNRPEFYTNLDYVTGKIRLSINRSEQIGNIVVKLEGEATTALQVPHPHEDMSSRHGPPPGPPGSIVSEKHKLLYKIQQVFPDEYHASGSNPYGAYPLQPGEHEFPFKFKLPINNACSDATAMSKIGGLAGAGGFGSGGGLFGMGGVRVMDGSKQLFLRHVTRTLPPSLTGFPMEAEIRYYIKVTVQRPGFLKENWRFQAGLKFLPIEPPRPVLTGQEGFARRPFTFRANASASGSGDKKKMKFWNKKEAEAKAESTTEDPEVAPAPGVELSARLPHPPILTCLQPVPLRLISKKLTNNPDDVYLISFQMELIGSTEIRCHNLFNKKVNRWVIASDTNLAIPITSAGDEVGKELLVPDDVWKNIQLPNTIAPSFDSCNISRKYELEIKLGVSWGKPAAKGGMFSKESGLQAQTIYLPLHFQRVEVYSGITPPPELLEAARNTQPGRATFSTAPRLPPRRTGSGSNSFQQQAPQPQAQAVQPTPTHDPLYPPQLAPGQAAPAYDDAPPSYDEAVAENLAGPFDGMQQRPAYSGVTNENAPSQMPQDTKG